MLDPDGSSPRLFRLALWLAVPTSVCASGEHQRRRSPGRLTTARLLAVRRLDPTPSTAASVNSPRSTAARTHATPPATSNPL